MKFKDHFLSREEISFFSIFQYRYNKNRKVVYLMKSKQQDFRTEKYIRYGIRKYSLGVASVAISAGLMFLGNGAVSAMELQGADTRLVSTSTLNTESSTETKTPENSIKRKSCP